MTMKTLREIKPGDPVMRVYLKKDSILSGKFEILSYRVDRVLKSEDSIHFVSNGWAFDVAHSRECDKTYCESDNYIFTHSDNYIFTHADNDPREVLTAYYDDMVDRYSSLLNESIEILGSLIINQ